MHTYVRVRNFTTKPLFCQFLFQRVRAFTDLFLVRIILIRTVLGIHGCNSAGDDALKVMLGTVKRNH